MLALLDVTWPIHAIRLPVGADEAGDLQQHGPPGLLHREELDVQLPETGVDIILLRFRSFASADAAAILAQRLIYFCDARCFSRVDRCALPLIFLGGGFSLIFPFLFLAVPEMGLQAVCDRPGAGRRADLPLSDGDDDRRRDPAAGRDAGGDASHGARVAGATTFSSFLTYFIISHVFHHFSRISSFLSSTPLTHAPRLSPLRSDRMAIHFSWLGLDSRLCIGVIHLPARGRAGADRQDEARKRRVRHLRHRF